LQPAAFGLLATWNRCGTIPRPMSESRNASSGR
jgi:hypothetical protein